MKTTLLGNLFQIGQVAATPGALAAFEKLDKTRMSAYDFLIRHISGDWGDLCAEDKERNDQAILTGERILSAYLLPNGEKVWIITESDRSVTTFLLPDEY